VAEAGKKESAEAAAEAAAQAAGPRVKWNVEHVKSSYVNFANANSTKEEVVLNFGMNTSWDRASPEVDVEIAHRLVMSPFAAQRLAELLTKLMADYKSRYGELK
jgi:hypothetical protein